MSPKISTLNEFVKRVPRNASVSATYNIVPHLTHRKEIYMFPNPFRMSYWGINGENYPYGKKVDFIIVDKMLVDKKDKEMLDELIRNKTYVVVGDKNQVLFLKRGFLVRGLNNS